MPSESNPDALRKKREGGAEEGPNSLQPPGKLVHPKGEVVCVKEQHQVRGREGGLKSKDYQDRQSRGRPY